MIDTMTLEELKARKQALKAELETVKDAIHALEIKLFEEQIDNIRIDAPLCRVVWDNDEKATTYGDPHPNEETFQILKKWLLAAREHYNYEVEFTDEKRAVIPRWKGSRRGEWLACRVWMEATE